MTAVFTAEEINILRAHYGRPALATTNEMRYGGGTIYGIENVSETYGTVDKGNPDNFTPIADSPITNPNFEGAGAVNEDGSMAYVVDNQNNMYALNILTGVYTLLGALIPPLGHSFTGLEFDPTDGLLYALTTDGLATALMVIAIATVTATLIGFTGMVLGIALAANLAGQFFAVDIDNDNLWSINKLTGLAIIIGAIGFDANFGAGMALSFISGVILLAAFNQAIFDSELRTVNIVTGITVLIGVMIIGTLAQFAWIGAPDPSLAVNDLNGKKLFEAYPNPVRDALYLEAGERIESVSIFDMSGRRVMYQPVDALNSEVSLAYLQSGHYVCKALVNGKEGIYKIVKQ